MSLFSYGAYIGISGENSFFKFIFWFFVVFNILGFPLGTIIAIWLIYLWREIRQDINPSA